MRKNRRFNEDKKKHERPITIWLNMVRKYATDSTSQGGNTENKNERRGVTTCNLSSGVLLSVANNDAEMVAAAALGEEVGAGPADGDASF
jgi:hypothetical protein